jgi:hypothetical protein
MNTGVGLAINNSNTAAVRWQYDDITTAAGHQGSMATIVTATTSNTTRPLLAKAKVQEW